MAITLKTPDGETIPDPHFSLIRNALQDLLAADPRQSQSAAESVILSDGRPNTLEFTPAHSAILQYHDLPECIFRLANINFDFALTIASYFSRGAFHELHPLPWERIERAQPPADNASDISQSASVSVTITCPKCNLPMDRGYLQISNQITLWVTGTPKRPALGWTPGSNAFGTPVTTFRCPRCNLLESYAT